MCQCHHRLGPADAVEPSCRQQVIRDEKRIEAQLLGPDRKATNLGAVLRVLARQQIGGDEDAELHAGAFAPRAAGSSSPATTRALWMRSRSASVMGSSGGRTVSRARIPCMTSA